MTKQKSQNCMTVDDLARVTNRAFGDLEKSLDERFDGVHQEIRDFRIEAAVNLRETEQRLVDALNRIEIKLPHFETLKVDVEDLSDRVGILEKKE
jgi:hypothetical protein